MNKIGVFLGAVGGEFGLFDSLFHLHTLDDERACEVAERCSVGRNHARDSLVGIDGVVGSSVLETAPAELRGYVFKRLVGVHAKLVGVRLRMQNREHLVGETGGLHVRRKIEIVSVGDSHSEVDGSFPALFRIGGDDVERSHTACRESAFRVCSGVGSEIKRDVFFYHRLFLLGDNLVCHKRIGINRLIHNRIFHLGEIPVVVLISRAVEMLQGGLHRNRSRIRLDDVVECAVAVGKSGAVAQHR